MIRMGLVAAGLGALVACTDGEGTGTPTPADDVAEYDALAADLEAGRTVLTEGAAQDYAVAGSRLFWLDAGSGIPALKSHDDETGEDLTYDARVHWPGTPGTPSDNMNFSAGRGVFGSMNTMDSLTAYDPADGALLDELVVPAPPYGQKWWAYAADGDDVYVMLIEGGAYHLRRWTPGSDRTDDVLTLDDLVAPNTIGEFTTFTVAGDTLMFYESGRLWIASTTGGKAQWTKNDEYVGGVVFTDEDVVYTQGERVFRYVRSTDEREELTDAIAAGYTLNATYPEPHLPAADTQLDRVGDTLYYQGTYGIFAYDLDAGTAEPVLLDARDNSTVYRYPTAVAATGALFVKGLESTSGAVGADGPTYRVVP
jgi:hypothetical protein